MINTREMIIALDPGKKTGVALVRDFHRFRCWEEPLLEAANSLLGWVNSGHRPTIVVEDFIYTAETAKKSRQTWSTEGIGMFRLIAHRYDLKFIVQPPVSAKKFSTDEKLKLMDWYHPSPGGHQNDAARHMLLYCVNQKLIDPRKLI